MTREKWVRFALLMFLVGGIVWVLKIITIATLDEENPFEGPLFVIGLVTLLVGSTGIGGLILLRAPLPLYVIACVVSPIVFWIFFTMMDPLGRAVFNTDRSDLLWHEGGILITAVIAVVLGLVLWRRSPSRYSTS